MKYTEYNNLPKEEQKKVPFKELPKRLKLGCFGVLAAIIVIIVSIATSKPKESEYPFPVSEYDGTVYTVENYLKATLNDWDSYESITWSKTVPTTVGGAKAYMVTHKYRAANGFGAKIIKEQIFVLNENGTVINVME